MTEIWHHRKLALAEFLLWTTASTYYVIAEGAGWAGMLLVGGISAFLGFRVIRKSKEK